MAVLGLRCCVGGLSSSCSQWGLLSSCRGWVFCCGGFFCCRAWVLEHVGFRSCGTQAQWLQFTDCRVWVQQLRHRSLVALCHVGSTRVGRWILYHWATREAPALTFRRGLWKGIRRVKRNLVCLPTDEPKYHRRWAVLLNAISGLVCACEITSGAQKTPIHVWPQLCDLIPTSICNSWSQECAWLRQGRPSVGVQMPMEASLKQCQLGDGGEMHLSGTTSPRCVVPCWIGRIYPRNPLSLLCAGFFHLHPYFISPPPHPCSTRSPPKQTTCTGILVLRLHF